MGAWHGREGNASAASVRDRLAPPQVSARGIHIGSICATHEASVAMPWAVGWRGSRAPTRREGGPASRRNRMHRSGEKIPVHTAAHGHAFGS
eukprot:scaffold38702_cov30-Tisochrysis_lutea.AAC.2